MRPDLPAGENDPGVIASYRYSTIRQIDSHSVLPPYLKMNDRGKIPISPAAASGCNRGHLLTPHIYFQNIPTAGVTDIVTSDDTEGTTPQQEGLVGNCPFCDRREEFEFASAREAWLVNHISATHSKQLPEI